MLKGDGIQEKCSKLKEAVSTYRIIKDRQHKIVFFILIEFVMLNSGGSGE